MSEPNERDRDSGSVNENQGPYGIDWCHGMVGGPAVIGPTGVVGFMQGEQNDRKAEDLCRRLNAAWKELGPTVEYLRKKCEEIEARVRDEAFAEGFKAGENQGHVHCLTDEVNAQTMILREERNQAEEQERGLASDVRMLREQLAEAQAEIEELKGAILGDGGWDQRCKKAEAEIERLKTERCTDHAAGLSCHDVEAEVDRLQAEIEKLKAEMIGHFQREHLEGDGPEIDRWKLKAAQAKREGEAAEEKRWLKACANEARAVMSDHASHQVSMLVDKTKREALEAVCNLDVPSVVPPEERVEVRLLLDAWPHTSGGSVWGRGAYWFRNRICALMEEPK